MSFEKEVHDFNIEARSEYERAITEGRNPWLVHEMADLIKALALTDILTRIRATIGTDGTTSFDEENTRRHKADEKPYFFRHEEGGLGAVDCIPYV